MIVPSERLLLWVAAIGIPAALLAAAQPTAPAIPVALLGGLAALAVWDALASRSRLAGLSLHLAPVARMSKDRPTKLDLRIRNELKKPLTVRLALSLPRAIQSTQDDMYVRLPSESEWSGCTWPCLGTRRGRYPLRSAHLETASPLGLWARRMAVPLQSEIRVYPNLLTERRSVAAVFLNRGGFGLHAQRQLGKGHEFEKLREYIPGDSYDEIYWKATARHGRPITKVFQVERTQEVYVVIDASRLSARPAAPVAAATARPGSPLGEEPATAFERFINAALVLGLAAEQQGDLFGLLTFSSRIERFVRAKNGKAHYSVCRDALYTLEPRLVTPDFDELCSFIRLRLRRRALLVFLTALDDPVLTENFLKNIDLLCRKHLVLVTMLHPAGVSPLFTGGQPTTVDELYQRLGGQLLWNELAEVQRHLRIRGVGFTLLENEHLCAELVSQYLAIKQRQVL